MFEKSVSLEMFLKLKAMGMTPLQVFSEAKSQGFKNYECLHIIMVVFDMALNDARLVSHSYYKGQSQDS